MDTTLGKAFIFDMDGVLVDSERAWEIFEPPMLEKALGKDISEKIGKKIGIGPDGIHTLARNLGSPIGKEELFQNYEGIVADVYSNSPITKGVDELARRLLGWGFKLGLVTQSPQSWIDRVLPYISFKDKFEVTISLAERPDLKIKPSPDGFREALRILDADPKKSFVLEDSNAGIAAGRSAGCYTIGFRGNLPEGYIQMGADAYADTMDDVISLVDNLSKS